MCIYYVPMCNVTMCSYTIKWFLASGGRQPRVTSNARPQGNFWDLSEPDPPSISPLSMPASSILHVPNAGFNKDTMLCSVTPMLYHVTLHVIMIHHVMQCYTLYCSRNTLLHQSYVVLCFVTPHISMLHHFMQCYTLF